MTESVSNIKIELIIIKPRSVSVIIAITANVAPSESDHTSPIKTRAGWMLNHKKAMSAPATMRQKAESMYMPMSYVIKPYAAY